MQFAHREMRRAAVLWLLLTVAAALAGPFGTHAALTPAARFVYWGAVVGAAIGLYHLFTRAFARETPERRLPLWRHAMVEGAYALTLAALVWGVNGWLFPGWGAFGAYAWLVGIVVTLIVVIRAGVMLLFPGAGRPAAGGPSVSPEAAAADLLRHLPVEKRAALVRIEAQDHYLLVVTRAGKALVLMRMADAEALLPPGLGLRVHRSHWVAADAVRGRHRDGDRQLIETSDGARIPVSRAQRAAARAAGMI